MKSFIRAIIFLYILTNAVYAQTIINVKRDFGAVGNGRTDDTKAFQRALERVNQLKKDVTLFIPKGTYRLNPQQLNESGDPAYLAVNILSLTGCTNVIIKGEKGTIIQFAPSLFYGAFTRKGKKVEKLGGRTIDYRYRVAVGHGIYLDNCRNITVQSLEMDGNSRNLILGGEFGDVGMQIDNDGIFINNSVSVHLENLYLHHFGRDGVMILNKTLYGFDSPGQDISFANCRFEYNGRQGFSWCGGVGLKAVNCFFGYTGKSKVSSPPGAGIDFEPNAGYIVRRGVFVNCTMQSNNGVAVIADEGGFNVRDIDFISCTIRGENSAALWVKSPAFRFFSCHIQGTFYFGCPAQIEQDGTSFRDCVFTDQFSRTAPNNFVVESNGARFLRFESCIFRNYSKGLLYVTAGGPTPAERAQFKNCRFVNYVNSLKDVPGSFTTGVDYTGTISFVDSSGRRDGWNIENSRFVGSRKIKSTINIGKNHVLASYDTVAIGDNKEPVTLQILEEGALLINTHAKLEIGKRGRLVIKKGGSLWVGPGAQLVIDGKIIAEEGAFICIHNEAKLSEASMNNITIQQKVTLGGNEKLKLGLSGCIIIPE